MIVDSSSSSHGENFSDEVDGVSSTNSRKTESNASQRKNSTFLLPGDIHPNMEHKDDEIAQLRLLAGKLSADWRGSEFMAPALARRIRDFQFAQEKRRKKYGDERPWGILGLYDHLSSIRIDVDWAEDAAWRRANGEPYQSWADFDESKKGRSSRPVFTYFALTACTVIMIASIAMNGWKVEAISDNPMSKCVLVKDTPSRLESKPTSSQKHFCYCAYSRTKCRNTHQDGSQTDQAHRGRK